MNAGEEIQNILLTLPKLKPFDTLDTVSEKQRISEMFTEENAELLSDYFIRRGKAAQTDGGAKGARYSSEGIRQGALQKK